VHKGVKHHRTSPVFNELVLPPRLDKTGTVEFPPLYISKLMAIFDIIRIIEVFIQVCQVQLRNTSDYRRGCSAMQMYSIVIN
jgi:hypothetical protein